MGDGDVTFYVVAPKGVKFKNSHPRDIIRNSLLINGRWVSSSAPGV
jgi:hypothetical protein